MRLTLRREEWAALAHDLRDQYDATAPPGLVSRIDDLLRTTPAGWTDQPCALELDPASAEVVTRMMADHRRDATAEAHDAQTAATVTEAMGVIQAHQRRPDQPFYRLEHRTGGTTTIIGWTSGAAARQEELSQHAARLIAAGATGELVLVDNATGAEVARRSLGEDAPPAPQ